MNHRLHFGSIAILSVLFAACGLGSYQPPTGNGGEGGEGAGGGGTGGNGNGGSGTVTSSGVGGSGNGGNGGSGGSGGSMPTCNDGKPGCVQHCDSDVVVEPFCKGSTWVCPMGTISRDICKSAGGCCANVDPQCPEETRCINGRCKERLSFPSCFIDNDCPTSMPYCIGAQVCACMAECILSDTPGTCMPQ
ncbi:hypothetical protein [Polyangium sorediatum]|uniref:PE-PGRS family protein n=1 Tax=Polyangium sorediatum TaxID=889274 RepID=A0ABT6NU05_9BACT|nr:hypothetical protein [Polyangium sorediatum]MDI1431797.1 hypothetical protein [Polyangium sorediatum]